MPRRIRQVPGGMVFHVLNPVVGHQALFHKAVERNSLRTNLVQRAEQWPWSSIGRWQGRRGVAMLTDSPVHRPADWVGFVNEPQTAAELVALRRSVNRGCPFGDDQWTDETVGG